MEKEDGNKETSKNLGAVLGYEGKEQDTEEHCMGETVYGRNIVWRLSGKEFGGKSFVPSKIVRIQHEGKRI